MLEENKEGILQQLNEFFPRSGSFLVLSRSRLNMLNKKKDSFLVSDKHDK
jgi:hypothetical protein